MQHHDLDDPYGFWTDKPTRQVQRTRVHGETQMLPLVRTSGGKIPSPQRRRNPLMRRLLVMVGASLLVVPVAFAFRTDRPDRTAGPKAVDPVLLGTMPASPTDVTLPVDTDAPTTTLAATTAAPTDAPTTVALTEAPTAPPTEAPTTAAPKKKSTPKPTTTPAPAVAAASQVAPTQPAACSATYTIVTGDTWSGIASRAKVSMNSLLAANGATINTVLLPGKKVCLPDGAQQPGPPTTKPVTTTTQAPATTQPKPATTTTQPPATTAPGTTQPAPPPNTYTKAQVTQIIRDIWPDNLEAAAIAIATRESNLIPTVHNYCCYGLFQIYFNANKTFLASVGVTSAAQLYDPVVNASAAYAMYQHSGWAPWGGDPTATTTTTVAP
jgi:LysM repeat protein